MDKCGQSIIACSVYLAILDKVRSWQGWYPSVREIRIVCQCFQIAILYNTDEAGAWDLKAGVEVDPASQEALKKMNESRDDEPYLILSMSNWNFLSPDLQQFYAFIFFYKCSLHMLQNRHYCELSSRGFWEDWSIIWQQRTWSKWFPLKVLVIYSALCEPEARAVMNMTSAPSERRTDSLAVKQALKSETVVGSRKNFFFFKKLWMKSLLAASATGIHQCLSRQLPWVGNELVSSVCVLKQARGTLILPNQGLCWHIPSVISLLLFYALPETERRSRGRRAWLALLLTVASSAGRSCNPWYQFHRFKVKITSLPQLW